MFKFNIGAVNKTDQHGTQSLSAAGKQIGKGFRSAPAIDTPLSANAQTALPFRIDQTAVKRRIFNTADDVIRIILQICGSADFRISANLKRGFASKFQSTRQKNTFGKTNRPSAAGSTDVQRFLNGSCIILHTVSNGAEIPWIINHFTLS